MFTSTDFPIVLKSNLIYFKMRNRIARAFMWLADKINKPATGGYVRNTKTVVGELACHRTLGQLDLTPRPKGFNPKTVIVDEGSDQLLSLLEPSFNEDGSLREISLVKHYKQKKKFEINDGIHKKIREVANENDYMEIETSDEYIMMSFIGNGVRVNVYPTKMTVSTCLLHPKSGKTQLHRKRVSMDQLKKIFGNPRVHTGKGYYKKT